MSIHIISGATLSECRNYRYSLWRIWDESLPKVMFIGLNPSKANETENDPTIKRVMKIAHHNGFGGVYMCNCFPMVTPYPDQLKTDHTTSDKNTEELKRVASGCSEIVFAWGNFKEVSHHGVDRLLIELFPEAKALHINKNGSPKHPLYCKTESKFIRFQTTQP